MTTATPPQEEEARKVDVADVAAAAAVRGGSLTVKLAAAGVAAALAALLGLVMVVAAISRPPEQSQGAVYGVSAFALADIPPDYLRLYQAAAQADGLDWAVLAGIGKVESDHGRGRAPGIRSGANFLGCCGGPMQFFFTPFPGRLAADAKNTSTWGAYGVDGNDDGYKDVWDPADAIPSAAKYLKASGAPGDYRAAIWAYNHLASYYVEVMDYAARYRGSLTSGGTPTVLSGDKLSQLVQAADALESRQLPYCYGGGHGLTPARPSAGQYCWGGSPLRKQTGTGAVGLDCSSSTSLLLQQIGYQLPTMTSGSFMAWGLPGRGAAVTIWTNPEHVFLEIRVNGQVRMFGTSTSNYRHGPGWHPARSTAGFVARHPQGL